MLFQQASDGDGKKGTERPILIRSRRFLALRTARRDREVCNSCAVDFLSTSRNENTAEDLGDTHATSVGDAANCGDHQ